MIHLDFEWNQCGQESSLLDVPSLQLLFWESLYSREADGLGTLEETKHLSLN